MGWNVTSKEEGENNGGMAVGMGVGLVKKRVKGCVRDYKMCFMYESHFIRSLTEVNQMAVQRGRCVCANCPRMLHLMNEFRLKLVAGSRTKTLLLDF